MLLKYNVKNQVEPYYDLKLYEPPIEAIYMFETIHNNFSTKLFALRPNELIMLKVYAVFLLLLLFSYYLVYYYGHFIYLALVVIDISIFYLCIYLQSFVLFMN